MKRKEFIRKAMGTMFVALPGYALVGCSSSDDGAETPNPNPTGEVDCLANGTGVTIGTNHGHTLTVSKEDVNAAVAKTYSIQGSSGHDHMVTISADDFGKLKNKTAISVTSTNDAGHTHNVAVSCA